MREWQAAGVVGGVVAWNFPLMLLVAFLDAFFFFE